MNSPTKFEINPKSGLPGNEQKLLKYSEAMEQQECDKKLIMPGKSHNECTRHVWDQSNEQLIQQCVETMCWMKRWMDKAET